MTVRNRRQADLVVGIVIVGILVLGGYSAVQLTLTSDATTMEGMESAPAIHYVGPLLVSLVVASVVGGVYAYVRGQVFPTELATEATVESSRISEDETTGETEAEMGTEAADAPPTDRPPEFRILEVLPEDEHRILEPVIESPGLTQIAVRDRSGFSRSKVSQTITDLEERGLLYRERQGRTYRVYPADDLEERV